MQKTVIRTSLSLALIFFLRMLGIFLILPVFILYAGKYSGATPILMGIALGCYGLTQACFQIPFGMLSDRFGRIPVIVAGLLIFIFGSLIAAYADSIYMVIAGRALQGAGAIAAAVIALAADLTQETHRSRTMALIGMGIGMAFALAFVAGPSLSAILDISGLFFISAILGVLAIIVLLTLVPRPENMVFHKDTETAPGLLGKAIKNRQLLQLYLSILTLHTILMTSFVVVPLYLTEHIILPPIDHWQIYLPALIISGIIIFPLLSITERLGNPGTGMLVAILIMALAQFGFAILPVEIIYAALSMFLFFLAFNYMEATLPTMVSKTAPVSFRGTALGVYSTSQFIGTFLGGLMGGYLYQIAGIKITFIATGIISIIWLLWSIIGTKYSNQQEFTLKLGKISKEQEEIIINRILSIDGVSDAMFIAEDGIAYLKVNRAILDYDALNAISLKTV